MDNNTNSSQSNIPLIGKSLSELQGGNPLNSQSHPMPSIQGKTLSQIQEEANPPIDQTTTIKFATDSLDPLVDQTGPIGQPVIDNSPGLKSRINKVGPMGDDDDERSVRKKESRGRGIGLGVLNPFKLIKNIKRLACLGCFTIFLILALLIVTVIFRPPVTWEPLKSFLNNDYNPPQAAELSIDDVKAFIDQNFQDGSATSVTLTEEQATAIVQSKFSKDMSVDLEPGVMKLVVDADTKREKPLWVLVQLRKTEDNKLEIEKIGFERFGLPDAINSRLGDAAFKAMNIAQGNIKDQSANNALSFLSEGSEFIPQDIENITFEKDSVVITYK